MKPVLVMGVHRGGSLFREALESVRPCTQSFESIVISINNENPDEDLKSAKEILDSSNRVILITGKNLSPVAHFVWMVERLKKMLTGNPPIMFMCHDDYLRADGIGALAADSSRKTSLNEVIVGDYAVFGDPLPEKFLTSEGFATSFLGELRDKVRVTRRKWFWHLEEIGYGFTNMSGLIAPLRAVLDVAAFLKKTRGSKGCRTEYLLASHHTIQTVRRYKNPVVAIRLHGAQESRHMAQPDLVSDELRYCLWLQLNAQSPAELFYQLLAGPQGVLAVCLLLRQWVKLNNPGSWLLLLLVNSLILLAKAVHYPARSFHRLIRLFWE